MKPSAHIAISAGLGVGLFLTLQSWMAAVSCFFWGVFIDLDHFVDYYVAKKKIPFKYKELDTYGCHDKHGKLYLFLHSFEMLALLWVIVFYSQGNEALFGAAVGLTAHMLCDQWKNPLRPWGYFLIYRIKHGFERKDILKSEYYTKHCYLE